MQDQKITEGTPVGLKGSLGWLHTQYRGLTSRSTGHVGILYVGIVAQHGGSIWVACFDEYPVVSMQNELGVSVEVGALGIPLSEVLCCRSFSHYSII
jgi:hypothetical protein